MTLFYVFIFFVFWFCFVFFVCFVSIAVCHCDGGFGYDDVFCSEGGLLSGFSVGIGNVGGIDISHLLFANDTLIFLWGQS